MFSTEEYNDKIEAYLKGSLSPQESTAFESVLSSDPTLKAEFAFQQSLITSIQQNRKAELKARLNNIQIPVAQPAYWRYAALAGVFSIAIVAIYLFPKDLLKSDKSEIIIANSDKLENLGGVTTNNQEFSETPEETIKGSDLNTSLSEEQKELKTTGKSTPKTTSNPETGKDILPSLPDIHSPETPGGHDHISKDVETPDHSLTKTKHISASVAGVEVIKSKKHKFHYRYFDTKLFLYGDFETKTYDILELNNSKGQKLYLKFESNYYELVPDKTEISKLEQVKAKETLKELEEIQMK